MRVRTSTPSRPVSCSAKTIVLVSSVLLLAACSAFGAGGNDEVAGPDATAPAGSESGPCPTNVVVQADWFPEVEHGGTYQLIGPGGTIDKDALAYSGPLRNRYKGAHGVQTIEIRSGGAAVDNQSVTDLMYADKDILFGFVNTDDAIAAVLDNKPVIGVVGSLDVNPQMLMWSPARFSISDFNDLRRTKAPVLHFPGMTYVDFLVSQGYISAEQPDATYGGDPSRWLKSRGDVIQQGFATNEVYTYTNVLKEWKRPVDFFLIHWMGYENYPAMMTIRTDQLNAQRACLDLLVPTLQRAWVEFLNEPTEVADTLVAINETFDTFFSITPDLNKQAIAMFSEFELATNGSDQVYGNFDPERVNRLFDIVEGIYAGRDTPLPATLVAADVFTNAFIDDAVGLAPQPAGESSGS